MSVKQQKNLSESAQVDQQSIQPFPRSQKVYVQGSRPDIRVPMREISLDVTPTAFGGEINAPVTVYDTSGPYTDPNVTIDVRQGLADVRSAWIDDRGDTEKLPGLSSEFGQRRLNDAELSAMRFAHVRNPRRAKAGQNVSQMHYAKKGIITPEMEYVAIRENMKLTEAREAGLQPGMAILRVGRTPVGSVADVERQLRGVADGDAVMLLVRSPSGATSFIALTAGSQD